MGTVHWTTVSFILQLISMIQRKICHFIWQWQATCFRRVTGTILINTKIRNKDINKESMKFFFESCTTYNYSPFFLKETDSLFLTPPLCAMRWLPIAIRVCHPSRNANEPFRAERITFSRISRILRKFDSDMVHANLGEVYSGHIFSI